MTSMKIQSELLPVNNFHAFPLASLLRDMEFCHIRKPFLVRGLGIELPVKYVFGNILRILSMAGTPIICIFYRRLYTELTADPKYSFIIGFHAVITLQLIPDSPVSLFRESSWIFSISSAIRWLSNSLSGVFLCSHL